MVYSVAIATISFLMHFYHSTLYIFKFSLLKNTINKALPLEISKSSEETGNINVEKMQPQLGVPGIASGARKPLSISNRQTSL